MSLQDSINNFIDSIIHDDEDDYSALKSFYEDDSQLRDTLKTFLTEHFNFIASPTLFHTLCSDFGILIVYCHILTTQLGTQKTFTFLQNLITPHADQINITLYLEGVIEALQPSLTNALSQLKALSTQQLASINWIKPLATAYQDPTLEPDADKPKPTEEEVMAKAAIEIQALTKLWLTMTIENLKTKIPKPDIAVAATNTHNLLVTDFDPTLFEVNKEQIIDEPSEHLDAYIAIHGLAPTPANPDDKFDAGLFDANKNQSISETPEYLDAYIAMHSSTPSAINAEDENSTPEYLAEYIELVTGTPYGFFQPANSDHSAANDNQAAVAALAYKL